MKKIIVSILCAALLSGAVSFASPLPQEAALTALAATASPSSATAAQTSDLFVPGAYAASSNGYGGPLSVEITVDGQNILSVHVLESHETQGIGTVALEKLAARIVEKQSLALDTVAGATSSSKAFLAAAEDCLLQAATDISFLMSTPAEIVSGEPVKMETDVVVVGGGLSGLCAAVNASKNGANVVLLEKLAMTGGSAKASLGSYMVCEVPENEPYHVTDEKDTLEAAKERWLNYQAKSVKPSQYPDMDRVSYMFTQTMFTIDWLKQFGATFAPKTPIAERGMAMVQVDVPDIPEGLMAGKLLERLKDVALEQGTTLLLETAATELIMDGEKVIGVKAVSPTENLEITGKNVILACGGFSENPELMERFIPEAGEFYTIASAGNTGDGILMAEAVGAALYEDPWVHAAWPGPTWEFKEASPYATVFMDSSSPLDFSESSYFRLMVDQDGNRFMNEAGHYSQQVLTMVSYQNGPYWSLYDSLGEEAAAIAEAGLPTGKVIKGNTVEDLALQLGMDPLTLTDTISRYNAIAQSGVDEDFGKPATHLSVIGEGPYYMIQMLPTACDTLGGVKTNFAQQVLREDGSVIDGLYAVGSMSNRQYYNQHYFSGSSLVFASTAGKIAGAAASAK